MKHFIDKFDEFKIEEKLDSKADVRNRGNVVFSATSSKVKDNKDHFPVNSKSQAINALARASQYSKSPSWFDGTLKELVMKVYNKVKKTFPSIEVTKKSKKHGKN